MAGVAAAVASIEPPAEARPLQEGRELAGLTGFELLGRQQGTAIEHALQGGRREPFPAELQQGQQALGDARLALLAAVRQTPGQPHSGGLRVAEDGRHQGREGLHLGRHHEDVPRLQAGVRRQQLQDLITHHLQLAQPPRAGVELQGAIPWLPRQGLLRLGFAADELLLQLLQQGRLPAVVAGDRRRGKKQIPLLPLAQLALAGAFEQLLKFRPEPAKASLEAGHAQQPVSGKGITQGGRAAALPEIAAGGEHVELHVPHRREGLQQFDLHRSQAAQAKQAERLRAGEFRPPAALEPADELPRPHAKGQAPEPVHQAPQQFRLPLQPLRQGLGLVAEPGLQQGRPVEPVVIDGIGDCPGQLPEGWIQGLQTGGANREPLAKGLRRWTL